MKEALTLIIRDFLSLVYPRNCAGCGKSLARGEELLCTICKYEMPQTGYEKNSQNAFARKFYGRIRIEFAISYLHFHKSGITQQILHNLKYRNQPEVGEKFGEWFAISLMESGHSGTWDMVLPIPLYISKEKKRGYNQSNFLAAGLGRTLGVPYSFNTLRRKENSETQTRKSREERWKNVDGIFEVLKPVNVKGKHILLVDDVVTTGATLESCGHCIMEAGASKISFATLAIAH